VTWVALVAFTVSVEEPPEVIDAGLALMLIVAGTVTVTVVAVVVLPPFPEAVTV
jgi:hypothetical protein